MLLLYPWILFGLIPLYFFYKKQQAQLESSNQNSKVQTIRLRLLHLCIALVVLALSRPVVPNAPVDQKFDAQEYIIALDASYSMQADDIAPTRYAASKELIKELLSEHPKDRFSLFAFTSNTLLLSPPTTDNAITLMALEALHPEYILTKSTNLGQLFLTIAKTSVHQKNLILFSDGGDENDLAELVSICKKNSIIPYIVAAGTKEGTTLKKDGTILKDQYSSLVISRINPILKDLAEQSGGKYYSLNDTSTLSSLSSDIAAQAKHPQQSSVEVQSYREFFAVPLFGALAIFFLLVTKLHQLVFLLPLFLIPNSAHAQMLDFYYLKTANSEFAKAHYKESAHAFSSLTPSVQSYYDSADAYYKAGHYKEALNVYTQIQSRSKEIKQKIFYNLGNCAVKLGRYDRAQTYYEQALALGEDADALYNLTLLQKLHLKTKVNISDMLPPKNAQTKQNSSKKTSTQKDEQKQGGGKSNSNQQTDESSNGAGDLKKEQSTQSQKETNKSNNKENDYKMGYKAYEMINKGYTDEKEPW